MKTYLAALIFLFFSSNIFAAECLQYRGEYFHDFYQADFVYFTRDTGQTPETCTDTVVLSGLEYASLANSTSQEFGLTYDQFLVMLPYLIGVLLGFKLFKIVLKQYFNW